MKSNRQYIEDKKEMERKQWGVVDEKRREENKREK